MAAIVPALTMDFLLFPHQLQTFNVCVKWTPGQIDTLPPIPICRTTAFDYGNTAYQAAQLYFDSTTGPILIIDCASKAQDRGILKTEEGYFVYVVFGEEIKYYKSNQ